MSQDGKMTLRYQLMAIARDVVTISAVVSIIGSAVWFLSRPYLQPYLEMPERLATIEARLAPIADPQLVEFFGTPQVIGPKVLAPGETLTILYHLRRNADCDTRIDVSFIEHSTGARITSGSMNAVKAPVTGETTYFVLRLRIPENLSDGDYSYFPRIIPIKCGVYKPYNGAITESFAVSRNTSQE